MTKQGGPDRRAVTMGATRADRARLRARLGCLQALRVAKATQKQYAKAYARFARWIFLNGIILTALDSFVLAAAQFL